MPEMPKYPKGWFEDVKPISNPPSRLFNTPAQPSEWSYGKLVGGPTGRVFNEPQWPDEIYGKIPQWVRDAAKKEKIPYTTDRELAMLWSQKTGKEWMLFPGWELDARRTVEGLNIFEKKNVLPTEVAERIWRSDYAGMRERFYGKFDPRYFSKDFLTGRMGYGYIGGKGLTKLITDEKSTYLGAIEDLTEKQIDRLTKAGFSQSELGQIATDRHNKLGIDVVGGRKYNIIGKAGKATTSDLFRDISTWEQQASVGGEPLVSKVSNALYKGDRTDWVLGRSSINTHFMTQQQQAMLGKEVFGQTKYLQNVATGKPILLGARNIVGSMRVGDIAAKGFAGEIANISRMEPGEALATLASKQRLWEASGDPTYRALADYLGPQLEDLGGTNVFRPGWRTNIRTKGFKDINRRMTKYGEQIAPMIDIQRAMEKQSKVATANASLGVNKLDRPIRKLQKAVDYIGNLNVNDKVLASGGVWGRVSDIVGAHQISTRMSSGKVAALSDVFNEYVQGIGRDYLSPEIASVRLWRDPIEGYPWNTRVLTPSGDQIASVRNKYAKTFEPEVMKGMLRGEYQAAIHPEGMVRAVGKKPAVSLIKPGARGVDWFSTGAKMKMTGTAYYSKTLNKVLAGDAAMSKATDLAKTRPTTFWPTKGIDVSKIKGKGIPPLGKGLLAGLALTAGALMLWSATRKPSQKLLDERDIPRSMHGSTQGDPRFSDGLSTYQPQARITPNSPPRAFSTDISMDTTDYNNVVDYRQLASTMSSMSRAALGSNNASVDLHVRDDSTNMNSYAMQRKFSEYLNK